MDARSGFILKRPNSDSLWKDRNISIYNNTIFRADTAFHIDLNVAGHTGEVYADIFNNSINEVNYGFYFYRGRSNFNNNIVSNVNYGFHIELGILMVLDGNHIRNSTYAIHTIKTKGMIIKNQSLDNISLGVYSKESDQLQIHSTFFQGSMCSIFDLKSTRTRIYGNVFEDNDIALRMEGSSDSRINDNVFIDNGIAMKLNDTKTTRIFKNSFMDNSIHVIDNGSNSFNDPDWGNYWTGIENYTDWDGNGIVDNPVIIDHDSIDHLPLIVPWGQPWNRRVQIGSVQDLYRINSGERLNITFEAYDPDGDTPTFEIKASRDVFFELDPLTGAFSFLGTDEYEGYTTFNITANDNNGTRNWTEFRIGVNRNPVIDPVEEIVAYPDEPTRYFLTYFDPDGDPVELGVHSKNAPFNVSVLYGNMLFFRARADHTGVWSVVISASDNNGSVSFIEVFIRIIPFNVPPVILEVNASVAYVGEPFEYLITVYDPNQNTFSFNASWSGKGLCSIDDEGLLLINPVSTDVGRQWVDINVSDNNGSYALYSFPLDVMVRNQPPTGPERIDLMVECGDVFTFDPGVADPEGERISYSLVESKYVWISIEDDMLRFSPRDDHVGIHSLVLRAFDPGGEHIDISLHIDVRMGDPPALLNEKSINLRENDLIVISILTDYAKNGTLSYSLVSAPGWASISGGRLILEPVIGDAGRYFFNITVSVVGGASGTYEMEVVVGLNLTGIGIRIDLDPWPSDHRVGDTVAVNVWYYDYPGFLSLVLEVRFEGSVIYSSPGRYHNITFEDAGRYVFYVGIEGYGVTGPWESVDVRERDPPSPAKWPLYLAISLAVILFFSIFVMFMALRRRRPYLRVYPTEPVIEE
ncbi:MAG: right-handed parallel beta-helix repeat-containing protein [Candidatus Thermoplasmatota archaeon]|nr:right-handed parallel beta-helix repeat-containing protein [Candidatus Thermoplasmatota archaeon]